MSRTEWKDFSRVSQKARKRRGCDERMVIATGFFRERFSASSLSFFPWKKIQNAVSCGSAITRAQFREFAKEIGRLGSAQLSSHLPFTSEEQQPRLGSMRAIARDDKTKM